MVRAVPCSCRYLVQNRFIKTLDFKALSCLLNTSITIAKFVWWWVQLSQFVFELMYRTDSDSYSESSFSRPPADSLENSSMGFMFLVSPSKPIVLKWSHAFNPRTSVGRLTMKAYDFMSYIPEVCRTMKITDLAIFTPLGTPTKNQVF